MTPALIVDPSSMGGLVWTGGNPVEPLPVVVEPDGALVALVDAAREARDVLDEWTDNEHKAVRDTAFFDRACDAWAALDRALAPFDPKEETDG